MEIAKAITLIHPEVLADLGCGDGSATTEYSKLSNVVIGIDVCRHRDWSKIKSVEFIVADINYLPFRPKSFDAVTMTEVLEHLDEDILFLKKVKNTLKDDGWIVLSTPNGARLTSFLSRLKIRIKKKQRLIPIDHRREYSPWEIRKSLCKAGFKVSSITYLFFCPYLPMPYRILLILNMVTSKFKLSPFFKWGLITLAHK